MFDGIILGARRRIVPHLDLQANLIDQFQQCRLEHVSARCVAAASIAQQPQRLRLRIVFGTLGLPPPFQAVASELTGVVAYAQIFT